MSRSSPVRLACSSARRPARSAVSYRHDIHSMWASSDHTIASAASSPRRSTPPLRPGAPLGTPSWRPRVVDAHQDGPAAEPGERCLAVVSGCSSGLACLVERRAGRSDVTRLLERGTELVCERGALRVSPRPRQDGPAQELRCRRVISAAPRPGGPPTRDVPQHGARWPTRARRPVRASSGTPTPARGGTPRSPPAPRGHARRRARASRRSVRGSPPDEPFGIAS